MSSGNALPQPQALVSVWVSFKRGERFVVVNAWVRNTQRGVKVKGAICSSYLLEILTPRSVLLIWYLLTLEDWKSLI